eukprot:Rhum_TRINITY_DN8269_c0_g1::Rhum_TRINITY_DN8269_c0_g1_i1::g.26996::m.26996/K13134/GEMIN6, SIP2; gem associated protein 6
MAHLKLIGSVVDVSFTRERKCEQEDIRGLLWNVDPETGISLYVARLPALSGDAAAPARWRVVATQPHAVERVEAAAGLSETEVAEFEAKAAELTRRVQEGSSTGGVTLEDLKAKLTTARLPFAVEESTGEVSVLDGAAVIRPPYTPETVESTNDQILRNVMRLVEEA